MMLRADKVIPAGQWSGAPADTVVLDFDERYRRRFAMTGVGGLAFLLDLAEAAMLRGGDGLRLEDGRIVEVVAAPEPLAEIRAADALALTRVAWHLGNRHLPTELMPKALRIRRDPVIEAMAEGLGARVIPLEAPFNPEGGAYVKAEASAATPTATIIIMITVTRTIATKTIIFMASGITGPPTPTIIIMATAPIMDTAATEADGGSLLPLLIWLSPSFPVGAFAYSHGLEWAVEAGDIVDARSLEGWLIDLVEFGAPRSDAVLFSVAFRSAASADWPALMEANGLAVALAVSAERRLETTAQGAAFVAAARAAWDCEPLRRLDEAWTSASPIRSRSPQRQAGTDCRSKRASRRSPSPRPPISSPPSCALGRSDRRTARRFSPRSCRAFGHWRARRLMRASPISAKRPFVQTLPPCVTKASIRGCSGHDARLAVTPAPSHGPASRARSSCRELSTSGSNVI